MNKLKEQLRFKMLGQLSDEKTNTDINNAYSVAVDFAVLFTSFVGETTLSYKEGIWRMKKLKPEFKNNRRVIKQIFRRICILKRKQISTKML